MAWPLTERYLKLFGSSIRSNEALESNEWQSMNRCENCFARVPEWRGVKAFQDQCSASRSLSVVSGCLLHPTLLTSLTLIHYPLRRPLKGMLDSERPQVESDPTSQVPMPAFTLGGTIATGRSCGLRDGPMTVQLEVGMKSELLPLEQNLSSTG
jgi:hypothetical protein